MTSLEIARNSMSYNKSRLGISKIFLDFGFDLVRTTELPSLKYG